MISAAVGGSSSESIVEDEKPSTSSSAEVRCVGFYGPLAEFVAMAVLCELFLFSFF